MKLCSFEPGEISNSEASRWSGRDSRECLTLDSSHWRCEVVSLLRLLVWAIIGLDSICGQMNCWSQINQILYRLMNVFIWVNYRYPNFCLCAIFPLEVLLSGFWSVWFDSYGLEADSGFSFLQRPVGSGGPQVFVLVLPAVESSYRSRVRHF